MGCGGQAEDGVEGMWTKGRACILEEASPCGMTPSLDDWGGAKVSDRKARMSSTKTSSLSLIFFA